MPELESASGPAREATFLRGCRVLVTRPAHQAEALCARIEAAGGVALRLPMIDILPVADPRAAAATLERARSAQRWIFSSANAVHAAYRMVPLPWPPVSAVGAATAAALSALGIAEVLVPEHGEGAAALLAHPGLTQVQAQPITLISGEQPLPELARVLGERGAAVESIAVYRRAPVRHVPADVLNAVLAATAAVVPSAEALQELVACTPEAGRAALFALQLAVPSPRVVEKARVLGFQLEPLQPQSVSDEGYVAALRRTLEETPGEQHRPTDRS